MLNSKIRGFGPWLERKLRTQAPLNVPERPETGIFYVGTEPGFMELIYDIKFALL